MIITSCHKSDSKSDYSIPTTTGQHIVSCVINGDHHVFKRTPNVFNVNGVTVGVFKGPLETAIRIYARSTEPEVALYLATLTIDPTLGVKYFMTHKASISAARSSYYGENRDVQYLADTLKSYLIFTRFDSLVVAGKFELHGANSNNDIVTIQEGWFDILR